MTEKFKKNRKNKDFIEILGFHATQAALKNTKRIHQKLIIDSSLKDKFKNLEHKVSQIISVPRDKFSKIYGNVNNYRYMNWVIEQRTRGGVLERRRTSVPGFWCSSHAFMISW